MLSSRATGGLNNLCKSQYPRRSSQPDPEPNFSRSVTTISRRNVSVLPTFGYKKTFKVFTAQRRRKQPRRFYTLLRGSWAALLWDALHPSARRSGWHCSWFTAEEPVRSRKHHREWGEHILPSRPSSKQKVWTLVRFIHPFVALLPSLPMKLETGRGDSSNAIFVTPSWDSLSPLLPLSRRSLLRWMEMHIQPRRYNPYCDTGTKHLSVGVFLLQRCTVLLVYPEHGLDNSCFSADSVCVCDLCKEAS